MKVFVWMVSAVILWSLYFNEVVRPLQAQVNACQFVVEGVMRSMGGEVMVVEPDVMRSAVGVCMGGQV